MADDMQPNFDDTPGKVKAHWLGSIATNIWWIFQAVMLVVTFGVGAITGSMASYISIKSQQEVLGAANKVLEARVDAIEKNMIEARVEDRAFAVDMRLQMSKITDILTEFRFAPQQTPLTKRFAK